RHKYPGSHRLRLRELQRQEGRPHAEGRASELNPQAGKAKAQPDVEPEANPPEIPVLEDLPRHGVLVGGVEVKIPITQARRRVLEPAGSCGFSSPSSVLAAQRPALDWRAAPRAHAPRSAARPASDPASPRCAQPQFQVRRAWPRIPLPSSSVPWPIAR